MVAVVPVSSPVPSVWLRPPPAPPGPTLSREALVRTIVALLDTDGLEKVSMRRLAAASGVTVGALYWYVSTKDELLELALDAVLGEARVATADRGWRAAFEARARALRTVLLRHPWALHVMSRMPNIGPNAVGLAGEVLAIADRAGFADPASAVAALHDLVVGSVVAELGMRYARSATDDPRRLAAHLAAAAGPPGVLPRIAEALTADAADLGDERFATTLRLLLDGLAPRAESDRTRGR
jgi:AcrR family transcriptional regulator